LRLDHGELPQSGHGRAADNTGVDQFGQHWRVTRRSEVAARAWDEKQYGAVTDADLLFRSAARTRFSGERFEALYRGWKRERVTEESIRREFGGNSQKRSVTFETCLLAKSNEQENEQLENG
jgi:hypothetical protein